MKKYMIAAIAVTLLTGVSLPSIVIAAPTAGPNILVEQIKIKPVKNKKKKVKNIQIVSQPNNTSTQSPIRSKSEVIKIQQNLVANGAKIKIDGILGPKTRAAMKQFNQNTSASLLSSKCQFLFWDYECPTEESNEQSRSNIASDTIKSPKHIKKAETMIGMTARKSNDRQQLKKYFAKNISHSIDPARIPWCAAWANAVLAESGYDTTNSLMARSFLHYGKVVREPRKGDIVILRRGRGEYTGHVGFFIERVTIDGKTYIAVLGGNQDKAVNVGYYLENKVLGYRQPVAA